MKIRTWMLEAVVVVVLLSIPMLIIGPALHEIIGMLAVFFTFKQTQVADRMAERQAQKEKPDVHCFRWFYIHFIIKEILWVTFFFMSHSWSALIGCGIFLAYPLWRKIYRKYKPLKPINPKRWNSQMDRY